MGSRARWKGATVGRLVGRSDVRSTTRDGSIVVGRLVGRLSGLAKGVVVGPLGLPGVGFTTVFCVVEGNLIFDVMSEGILDAPAEFCL
jgi:hypothetical protein